jgi:N-methylhydantoinase A/oxoprolinase/acetone carboxylase beta subunit
MEPDGVHVIGCGVLAADLEAVAQREGMVVSRTILPAGLHARPNELRLRVQEAIDHCTDSTISRIALAYGVCGRGTVGIAARAVPLAIPRVHDCIALFLGSDAEYRRQFHSCSGTYYVSAGWVQSRDGESLPAGPQTGRADDPDYGELVARYGAEHADIIQQFLGSWQRNYRRAAYIDTGVGGDQSRYERVARQMAKDFGWRFERLEGTHALLHKLLRSYATDDDILVVQPGQVTHFDALHERMEAGEPISEERAGSGYARTRRVHEERITISPPAGAEAVAEAHVGIGIDAGGTFTDVVLFDMDAKTLLAKTKAPTTHWDYSIGIREALSRWEPEELRKAEYVALSTTLATNAIVEGQGQKVGLLVMPPYGLFDRERFRHRPVEALSAKLDIEGEELHPVDLAQVLEKASRMVAVDGVEAFAVGGFASHANPAHEALIAEALIEHFDLPVTCSHELSDGLNYRVRAETAALNAGILPCIELLLDRLEHVLEELDVHLPVYVVCSDGALMGLDMARRRPLLTMLSGPAASVAGALHLAGVQDAVVADMGGTTTDLALVANGRAALCEDGARVGQWQTHVRALDLRTMGLGGDSIVELVACELAVGPRRVASLSSLEGRDVRIDHALDWLEGHPDVLTRDDGSGQILWLCGSVDAAQTPAERELLGFLSERPRVLREVMFLMGKADVRFLPLAGLESRRVVSRVWLTPTDVLHVMGRIDLWSSHAAKRLVQLYADLLGVSGEAFCAQVLDLIGESLTAETLLRALPGGGHEEGLTPMVRDALFGRTGAGGVARLRAELGVPVVGIGAPAASYLPALSDLMDVQVLIPEHAEVANAVGAAISRLGITHRVSVALAGDGRYRVDGAAGDARFGTVDEATEYARDYVLGWVRDEAAKNGARHGEVEVVVSDHTAPTADGGICFVSRHVEAHLEAAPAAS